MIRLDHLSKSFRHRGQLKVIANQICADIPTGRCLALLGRNGAGKSSLLKMIAGTMAPTQGRVVSDGTISWPVGFGGSFHGDLTGAQNTRFVARIYGVDANALLDFVAGFSQLGPDFHKPFRSYSHGMKSRLAFGVSMGVRFDTYLVDEITAVGDAAFRARSAALLQDRLQRSGAIVVSHAMGQLREYCDCGAVLEAGTLHMFDNLGQAIDLHEYNMRRSM